MKARGEILKQVIRLRSSKTSFIFFEWGMVRMTLGGVRCFANGQWLTANGCLVVYLCLFCKILLGYTCLSKIALYFCVARENLRPRHAENFSMRCAWRGVKKFCVGSALRAVQCHG